MKLIGCLPVVIIAINIVFFGTVIYVAAHFIGKFW